MAGEGLEPNGDGLEDWLYNGPPVRHERVPAQCRHNVQFELFILFTINEKIADFG